MTLPGFVLLAVVLTSRSCDGVHFNPPCDDCNLNGPWWPLFKPSQIIHSEFPEHGNFKAIDRQFTSYESSSQEQPGISVINLAHEEAGGVDSKLRSSSSQSKHRVEWDHYGDISRVTTVPYNSLEDRSATSNGSAETPPNSLDEERIEEEDVKARVEKPAHKDEEDPEKDASVRTQAGSFFDEKIFFDEKTNPKNSFPEDFEISKEASSPEEADLSSNSIEHDRFFGSLGSFNKPVATSYSSMSSVFTPSRPVPPQQRDLLHPLTYKDVPMYVRSHSRDPAGRSQFNTSNTTQQYLVHERPEDPGVLVINHGSPEDRGNRPPSFVPLTHPVYRYVKNHGGLLHHYGRKPMSRSSTLRWQDIHPELRARFPFSNLQPHARVQNHETVVHHVVPTKDYFSDSFWKDSKRIEHVKPPPSGDYGRFFKKKPNWMNYKMFGGRDGHTFVYIIRKNKRLT